MAQTPVREGQFIEAEAFVFAEGENAPVCATTALTYVRCAMTPRHGVCSMKQPRVVVADSGVTIDFDNGSGQCDVSGQLTAQADVEACDAADNDCDGRIDEGLEVPGADCQSDSPGICAAGHEVCRDGMVVLRF